MKELRRNLLVGAFVLAGLGIFGTLIVLFGRGPTWLMGANTYTLDIFFDSVSGIRSGTVVTVGGKDIGRVQSVEFRDPGDLNRGVKVVVSINNNYRLPRGSRAETTEAGLGMGRPPIQIVPGLSQEGFLTPGSSIPGSTRKAVESLFPGSVVSTVEKAATQLGEAAAAMTPVLQDMHGILQARLSGEVDRPGGPPGNLASAITRLDMALKHFNTVIGDPQTQEHVKQTVANFRQISEDGKAAVADFRVAAGDTRLAAADFRALMDRGKGTLDKVDGHIERVARATVEDLEKAGRFMDHMNEVGRQISRGEGTLGRLVKDERLYEAMVLSFKRLAETVEEFRVVVKDWQQGKIRVGF